MDNYVVSYSIGTNSTRYEEVIRTQSEAAARQIIMSKYSGQLIHIWSVKRQ